MSGNQGIGRARLFDLCHHLFKVLIGLKQLVVFIEQQCQADMQRARRVLAKALIFKFGGLQPGKRVVRLALVQVQQ
ncbi:hypothetical protein D3C80_1916310 [compost metagenome]